jgi:hypothetical protein
VRRGPSLRNRSATARGTARVLKDDERRVTLGEVLAPGQEFQYRFDMGDNWRHHCGIADDTVDFMAQMGIVPDRPLPYWGWA